MLKAKRIFLLLLALVLALSTLFALTACGDKEPEVTEAPHVHSYVDTVVDATCTADGYTLHACACGNSYKDAVTTVAHTYTSKVTRYPTTLEKGVRRYDCTACGHSYTAEITALASFTMPSIADALADALPQGTYRIALDDAEIIKLFSEIVYKNDEKYESEYNNTSSAFRAAEVTLNVGDVVTGVADLTIDMAQLPDGDLTLAEMVATDLYGTDTFSILLNGDAVTVAINGDSKSYSLSEEYYEALADSYGMSVEELADLLYVETLLYECIPDIEATLEAIADSLEELDIPNSEFTFIDLLALLYTDAVVIEKDGDTTVTTLDLSAISTRLSSYTGKTIAGIIDESYGAGTAAELIAAINAMPDKKISAIANEVFDLADALEMDADAIFAYINLIVYLADGEAFDIEVALQEYYDLTLAELVAEDDAAAFKQEILSFTASLSQETLAGLFHDMGCPAPAEHTKATCGALNSMIEVYADLLGDTLSLEIVTVETQDGTLLESITVQTPFASFEMDEEKEIVASMTDGDYTIRITKDENGSTLDLLYKDVTVLDADALVIGDKEYKVVVTGYDVVPTEDGVPADPNPDVAFSYGALITLTGAKVYDIGATPGAFDSTNVSGLPLILNATYDGVQYAIAIYDGNTSTPMLALGVRFSQTSDAFTVAALLDVADVPKMHYTLLVESDTDTCRAVLTDMVADAVVLDALLTASDEVFEIVATLNPNDPNTAVTYKLIETVEDGDVTYTVGVVSGVELAPLASVTLTEDGFVLVLPSVPSPMAEEMIETTIGVMVDEDGDTYSVTLAIENGIVGSRYPGESYGNEDNGDEYETWYTKAVVIDGSITVSYTAPAN